MSDREEHETEVHQCPFPDCDWSLARDGSSYEAHLDADLRAQMHYESEHAGRVELRATISLGAELLGPRDPIAVATSAHEDLEDDLPERWSVEYVVAEIVDEADDHSKLPDHD